MRKHILIWLATLVALLAGLVPLDTPLALPPSNFQTETLIGGLTEPTALQFLPGGRMLIINRFGIIWVVQPGATQIDPTPFLQINNINTDEGERGLVGITLDPDFSTNSFYYVFYTAAFPLIDRVSRFTASGDSTVPGSEVVTWQDDEPAGLFHHGGNIAFGLDGKLYISTGDFFDAGSSQSLQRNRGKILRVNADGTVPSDNPFFDGAGPNLDAIWALGLRNPFRFSFDPVTGRMYIGDVGEGSIEEVNLGVAGANYGWPVCEGTCGTTGMTNPLFQYPHNSRDASITGGFVYSGAVFPQEYQGSYFYADYAQNWIRRLTFDGSGNVTSDVPFEPADGSSDGPYGDIVDLKQGPDGALYYVDIGPFGTTNTGSIRRIRYIAGNQPPTAVASANPLGGLAPLTVAFSSVGSSDPEGQPLTYLWIFGDGDSSTAPDPSHTYQQSGQFTARLSVSDGINTTQSNDLGIQVGNPPTPLILTPGDGITFRAGDVINFSGSATDPEDGTLGPSAFSWTVVFQHDTHSHPEIGPITGTMSGSFTIPTSGHSFAGNTRYEIFLTVTDTDGLQTTRSVSVIPEKVNLTFDSVPSGLTLGIDGISRLTPSVVDTLIGFQHVVTAPHQAQGGTQYNFTFWSDGGVQTHTISVPATNQTYTANYTPGPTELLSYSLRFYGNGVNDIDRVKISIDNPERPVDVGSGDFTIEFWMKAGPNTSPTSCTAGNNSWIGGNIVIDRDVFFEGDFGDYGLSVMNNGRLAFGANNGTTGANSCGATTVTDNAWHHVAVTRNGTTGELIIFLDGVNDGSVSGPTGNLTYRNGRATGFPNSDPYLVLGAEKHDVPGALSYNGFMDELRISNNLRYTANFTRPGSEFTTDASTMALYHFNEGSGTTAVDSSGAPGGPSNGTVNVGGTPQGPEWSIDTPFPSGCAYSISPTNQSVMAGGGAASVNVTAAAGCGWTASSNAQWITITSGSSGTGDGAVGYAVAVNPGGSRTGTLTVAGLTFTVNQGGPTLVTLVSFNSTGYTDGVLLEWQTGYESNNLGFNIYRDEGGKRELVNGRLIAGSALMASSTLGAGEAYTWWDGKGQSSPPDPSSLPSPRISYWLEAVDLNGESNWYGPSVPIQAIDKQSPRDRVAKTLAEISVRETPTEAVDRVANLLPSSASTTGPDGQIQSIIASSPGVFKLQVQREAWYRISAKDLFAAGLDPSTEPHLLQLFVDGKQVSIAVVGQDDGRFDATDTVEFYGMGIDSPFASYRTYYLMVGRRAGLRIANTASFGQPSPGGSFLLTLERRDRSVYFSSLRNGELENFFGPVVVSQPVNQILTVNHPAPAAPPAVLNVAIQGVTNLAHLVNVKINGSVLGEVAFKGLTIGKGAFSIPSALLNEGANVVTLVALGGPADVSLVDYLRLTYQHSFTADDDSLRFPANAGQELTIDGFSRKDIQVFDVTDPYRVQEVTGYVSKASTSGFAVSLTVPGQGSRELLARRRDKPASVANIALDSPSTLRNQRQGADLVIISSRELFDAAKTLGDIRLKQGLAAMIVNVDDIYDEFSFGQKTPQALKDFIRFATESWQKPVKYVMFFGDASLDPKNYLGLGDVDLVPTRLIDTTFMETASDDWLADFDGDGIADIGIGRLPVRNVTEAESLVRKIIEYEQVGPPDATLLLVSDLNDSIDFEGMNEQLIPLLPPDWRVMHVSRGRLGDQEAHAALIKAINRGQRMVSYAGHGSGNLWGGGLLSSDDALQLRNRDKLAVFSIMNCLNGYFVNPSFDGLGEALLKSSGGAVAVWTSSAMTSVEGQAPINQEFYRLVFEVGQVRLGDAAIRAKAATLDLDVRRTWILLGDPTMTVNPPK